MESLEARALELFERLADLAPEARARRLDALRAADAALHAELTRLFAADALPEEGLPSPQALLSRCDLGEPERQDPRIGTRLGAWRIDSLIGSGGMGRVYLASRADGQYAQTVALKCIQVDGTAPVLAEVLRNERDMLAMLEHPNIATLLDGGLDAEGCPWFAMQRVQGEPIDQWCDHHRLDLRARVRLFLQLCEGLRYAHGKGALHSDLKPSNVLVDESGRAVLLDFGLSSLTARSQGGGAPRLALSLGYTAPEVATTGNSVAADIYSMGILLRLLLCGAGPRLTPPLGAASATAETRPGACARRGTMDAAQRRGKASPRALARALEGDLDSIVAACVAPEPSQRPASVAHLQQDLRAWLEHRPVSTRRATVGYRLARFVRRHRLPVAAAVVLVLVAAIGLGIGLHLRQRVAGHAQDAQAMRRLFEESFDTLTGGGLGQSPLVSAAMLREVEARLRVDEAAGRLGDAVASQVLTTLARSHTALGDYPRAEALLLEAATRAADRADLQPGLQAARAHLLNIQSRPIEALAAALLGATQLDAVPRADRELARLTLEVETARAQWGMTRIDEGRATLAAALARAERLAASDPRPLASLLIQEGQWLRLFLNYEAAVARYERAIALSRERAPLIADQASVELASTYRQLSRHGEAVELAATLVEQRRQRLGETHPETGRAWLTLGAAQFWKGMPHDAMVSLERSERILSETLGDDHPETARARLEIGLVQASLAPDGDAEAIVRPALAIIERAYGPDHMETSRGVAILAAVLAVRAPSRPDPDAAWAEVIDLFARRVDIGRRQGLPTEHDRVVLIKARLRLGQVDLAQMEELEDIVSALRERFGPLHDTVHNARLALVEVYLAHRRIDDAKALLEQILREVTSMPATLKTVGVRVDANEKLGDVLRAEGRNDEARAHWQQALDICRDGNLPPFRIKRLETRLAQLDAP